MADKSSASIIVASIKKLLDSVELQTCDDDPSKDFDYCLDKSITPFCVDENLTTDLVDKYLLEKYAITSVLGTSRWRFISVAVYLLLKLKEKLESCCTEEMKETLLSINEEKEVKRCAEICVSLGLMGALLPNVGIPMEKRSKYISLVKCDQEVDIVENYNRLCFITKVLFQLFTTDCILKSITQSNHLGDYLSSLFQLCYTPLLKPGASNKQKTFTMNEEFYARLVMERQQFKTMLSELLSSVNQAELLKQIMILFGYAMQSGPKRHVWFTNACTNILNDTLNKPNGIETVLKAMCDEDYTSPLVWRKLDIVAKIIATMNTAYNVTCPQVLQMLQYSEDLIQASDQLKLYNQFAIATCKHFHQHNPGVFHTHVFSHVIAPIEQMGCENKTDRATDQSPEHTLSTCLLMLDRLFSHVDGLPRELLVKYTNRLFFIYFNIHSSPIYIPVKSCLENLLLTLWSSFSVEQCAVLLNQCVFQVQYSVGVKSGEVREESLDEDDVDDEEGETYEEPNTSTSLFQNVLDISVGTIAISTTGNLSYVETNTSVSGGYEQYGITVLELMNKHKANASATQNLFICLLQNYTKEIFKDDLERNVVNVKLLNDLGQNIQIEHFVSTNPQHIIMFIEYLIKQSINQDETSSPDNTDSLCTGLTLLTILMSDKNTPLFSHIIPSLESLLNYSTNEEVNILARQVLDQIKAANPNKGRGSKKLRGESYEKAMSDACDPLLPVRAHGIVTLTKLILSGDATAKSNKCQLLCLFMENLSHEDSYLYLSAVEGLAALTVEHADSVVETLTQQFIGQDQRELECRLKLGEVLMRVARHLGEMLVKFKSQFLNAFLHGCKDEDHLMRTSSLSNLAEICRILGYRIGSILSEIFICIKSIISSDPYPEPRRAAVMVASFLLCGLKHEALQVLEPILPELYRTLRHIYDHDCDDRTRLHAQLALEQLNEAVKTFLTPSLPAEFKTLRL
ncbi:hypothetical protein WDU94_008145 [Cyamophila willieti]